MPKLGEAGARAVVFDIAFEGERREFDDDFVRGAQQLAGARVPVIAAMPLWDPSRISGPVRAAVKLGGGSGIARQDGFWDLYTAVENPGNAAQPSIALATALAVRVPGDPPELQIDAGRRIIEVRFREQSGDRVTTTTQKLPVENVRTLPLQNHSRRGNVS
jgi:hypothetical protein